MPQPIILEKLKSVSEDLQDLPELTEKRYPFHHRDWDAKVGSQEITGVTGNFGLGVQNEQGKG